MWYPAAVTTPASSAVLTDAMVKEHLREDFNDQDAVIANLAAAAVRNCENYCGIRLGTQALTLKCDSFADFCRVPEAPIASITSISYVDTNQAAQTLAGTVYELRADGLEASIALKYGQQWPALGYRSRITVVLAAGFSVAPPELIAGMCMLVAHWYKNREAVSEAMSELPIGPAHLFENYRRFA